MRTQVGRRASHGAATLSRLGLAAGLTLTTASAHAAPAPRCATPDAASARRLMSTVTKHCPVLEARGAARAARVCAAGARALRLEYSKAFAGCTAGGDAGGGTNDPRRPTEVAGPAGGDVIDNAAAAASVMHEDNGTLTVGPGAGRRSVIVSKVTYTPASKSRAEMRIGTVPKGGDVDFSFDLAIDSKFAQRTGVVMQMIGPPFNQPSFALDVDKGNFAFAHGPDEKSVKVAPAVPNEWHTWRFMISNHGPNASIRVLMDGKVVHETTGNTDNGQRSSVLRIGAYTGRDMKGDATAYIDAIRLTSGVQSAVR